MKVLIVEDEALLALYFAELVTSFGHEVCAVAASGPEAIHNAAKHAPDVVLMDIRLAKDTSGVDVALAIYSRSGVRCIFLSGNLDEGTRLALQKCAPIDFIGKPVLPFVLRRALEKAEQELGKRPYP